MAAFYAEFEHILDVVVPNDSKDLFVPLVFQVAELLTSGPIELGGSYLSPLIDSMVVRIVPDFKTQVDLRQSYLNYLQNKEHKDVVLDLYGLRKNSVTIAGARLAAMIKQSPEFAKDHRSWEEFLVDKFNYSEDQVESILSAPNSGARAFLSSVLVLVAYRAVALRALPGGAATAATATALVGGGGGAVQQPVVPTVIVPPPAVPTAEAAMLAMLQALLAPLNERLAAMERVQSGTGGGRASTQGVLPRGTGGGMIDISGDAQDYDQVEQDELLARALEQMAGGAGGLGGATGKQVSSISCASGVSNNINSNVNTATKSPIFSSATSSGTLKRSTVVGEKSAHVTGSWFADDSSILMCVVSSLQSAYGTTRHLSMYAIQHSINGLDVIQDGLITIDISGIPHAFIVAAKLSSKEHHAPTKESVVYNPDKNRHLASLGVQFTSKYIHPVTIQHFLAFIKSQIKKATGETCIEFVQTSPGERVDLLMEYQELFVAFAESKLGPVEEMHRQPFHVTGWAALVCLHNNLWMRAMLGTDLTLLTRNFDYIAESQYGSDMKARPSGSPKIDLRLALEILGYRCPKCSRRGCCKVACENCLEPSAKKSESLYPPGYPQALKTWKDANQEKVAKWNGYRTSKEFVKLFPQFAPVQSNAGVSLTHEDLSVCQELVEVHSCEGRVA